LQSDFAVLRTQGFKQMQVEEHIPSLKTNGWKSQNEGPFSKSVTPALNMAILGI